MQKALLDPGLHVAHLLKKIKSKIVFQNLKNLIFF